MTPERHALVRGVFLEAVAVTAAQRPVWLEQRCRDDAELRVEVEKLLAHHDDGATVGASSAAVHTNMLGPEIEPVPRPSRSKPLTSGQDRETLLSGTVLAGRYRIVALLGQGGMGSVYRADDLTLDQPVALKFLDQRFADRADWVQRFRNEVRLARRVTHPNVCRVFDIGDDDGRLFLSMEYVDGEDLGRLIKRLGRFSFEKAIDIARQICTGLAAAHGAGVLHRDLKPANIMLDGQGNVRITDFGIAIAADAAEGRARLAGTPAYMAPEQITGREVDVRSDIYALGLVLYELFSGQPAFRADSIEEYARLHTQAEPAMLCDVCADVDPDIERLVQACLSKNPEQRPQSALAVAAALPGVDVLSIALNAEQLPMPSLVAGAPDEGVRAKHPLRFLLMVLGACVLLPFVRSGISLPWEVPGAKPPVLLAEQARHLLAASGHGGDALDSALGYCQRDDAVLFLENGGVPASEAQRLSASNDELLFWYRQSPDLLVAQRADTLLFRNARTALSDPPSVGPDQQLVVIDQLGRVILLAAVPARHDVVQPPAPEAFDSSRWQPLFAAAGMDMPTGRPAALEIGGALSSQSCGTWTYTAHKGGTGSILGCSVDPDVTLFAVMDDRLIAREGPASIFPGQPDSAVIAFRVLILLVTFVAMPLAWRNCRAHRADVSGAVKAGALVFGLQIAAFLFGTRHVPDAVAELLLVSIACIRALGFSAIVTIFYLALEPLARRYWPHLLISWTRLLRFDRLDLLIWQHVLVGTAIGSFWALVFAGERFVLSALGWSAREPFLTMRAADRLLGGGAAIADFFHSMTMALAQALLLATLLALMRAVVKSPFRAAFVTALVLMPVLIPRGAHPATSLVFSGLGVIAVAIWAMTRFGLLAVVVATAVASNLNSTPLSFSGGSWHAPWSYLVMAILASIATYAFVRARTSMANSQPR